MTNPNNNGRHINTGSSPDVREAQSPPKSPWTDAQQRAIEAGGRDILVAAGAGSGKTRVLVERILQRIAGEEKAEVDGPRSALADIDRFLVVTFTNAAAAEMKHRIAGGLKKILSRRPGDAHVRRQLLLLNRARISTIHAFCMEVIQRYAYLRSMDTAFRIVDENEAALLRFDALETLLETCYAEHPPGSDFYRLIDLFSTDRGDQALQELVLKLYDFSRSQPSPESWLREQVSVFAALEPDGGGESPWERALQQQALQELSEITTRLERALELTGHPGGPEPYRENLETDLEAICQVLDAAGRSWEDLAEAVHAASAFGRLKSCRSKDQVDPALKDRVSALRKACKEDFNRLKNHYFKRPLAEQREELQRLAPVMGALVDLVEGFGRVYESAKREKSLADFPDLEHRALQLLTHPDSPPDAPEPSEAALDYRRQFLEVLVDEYQDINPVQEAILQRVAAPAPRGNRFMVGDVKQSIYRFRLAEPHLFQEKYRQFHRGMEGQVEEKDQPSPQACASTPVPTTDSESDFAPSPETISAPVPVTSFNDATAPAPGDCIVLSKNFRSRREILDAVNDLFAQFMDEDVGEIDYDDEAELRPGTDFPTPQSPVTFYLVDREGEEQKGKGRESSEAPGVSGVEERPGDFGEPVEPVEPGDPGDQEDPGNLHELADLEDLSQAELEGRLIAREIVKLLGLDGSPPLQIYDREDHQVRPVRYRDVVILLRSARGWAPAILEALQQADIPAYVDLGTGYFSATEVEVILSLLKVIDNPYQDIPLGAVLRSPLVGLDAGELAAVRTAVPTGPFFDAVKAASDREKIQSFLHRLYRWQDMARQNALADLVWDIYRETGYYDFVGGLPGGRQRQANLRALYDRARQYEAARFRGLFRFLRFIEKVRERGGDLGEARALGEQENVVRIMTVHKSKGLEFPVVFVAGLGKDFNLQDVSGHFLIHKAMGFGPRVLDLERRVTYPTLAWHAIRQRLILETLSEEMRILYVAMTRAEEKLFLVGSVKSARKALQRWAQRARRAERLLSAPDRARGRTALDWIGPALLRHPDAGVLRALCPQEEGLTVPGFPSAWEMACFSPRVLQEENELGPRPCDFPPEESVELRKRLAHLEPLPGEGGFAAEVKRRLEWDYPYRPASEHFAKLSVSELSKVLSAGLSGEDAGEPAASWAGYTYTLHKRPAFLGQKSLSPGERGSAYHAAMQHLSFAGVSTVEEVARQLDEMLQAGRLTRQEREALDPHLILSFFQSPLGQRVLSGKAVYREVPFSLAVPLGELQGLQEGETASEAASEAASEDAAGEDETVLVQGVLDCLVREEKGFLLVDFKTGSTKAPGFEQRLTHYRVQLSTYARAVEQIWKEPVSQCYLYFIDDQKAVEMERPPVCS